MLVFIAGWNVAPEVQGKARAILSSVAANYPHIDTSRHYQMTSDTAFVRALASPPSMSAPSLPVVARENRITLVAGTALAPGGGLNAMHADDVARNMERASEFEGQFVIVDGSTDRLEIVNDGFGIYPVFVVDLGDAHLLSNSATALALLAGLDDIDPLGMSTFLEIRWPMADRTLIEGVRVLPGGQRWTFRPNSPPSQHTHYDYRQLARLRTASAGAEVVSDAVTEMAPHLEQLALQTQSLQIPMTAGRDTRVMVALSLHQQVASEYFTVGDTRFRDVQTAKAIAQRFDLHHRHDFIEPGFIRDNWSHLAEQVVRRNDGLVTLEHVDNVVDTVTYDYRPIMLYGVGGEIARGHGHDLRTCFGRPPARYLSRHLRAHFAGESRTLLTKTTQRTTRRHLRAFVTRALEDGFSRSDLPELIKVLEKTRRWGGHQSRQVSHQFNVFTPFGTRPYVEAAFRLTPVERVMEIMPVGMIRHAAPQLLAIDFDKPLPPDDVAHLRRRMAREHRASAVKAVARSLRINAVARLLKRRRSSPASYSRIAERSTWLDGSRSTMIAFCLDQTSSQLWRYVSRPDLERLWRKGEAVVGRAHLSRLLDVVTAFSYEHYLRTTRRAL